MGNEDPLETAKSLLAKLKHAKLFDAFKAWKNLAHFETTVIAAEVALEPYEDTLNTPPQLRNNKSIHALCKMLSKVKAYSQFPQPVLELLATYCRLLVVWDTVELPRGAEDSTSLFSVVSGGMSCVCADPQDPVLRYMVKEAAEQLLEVEREEQRAAEKKAAAAKSSPFAQSPRKPSTPPTQATTTDPDGATAPAATVPQQSPAGTKRKLRRSETLKMLGLPAKLAGDAVRSRLWHTVAHMVHAGRVPNRREAEVKMQTFDIEAQCQLAAGGGANGVRRAGRQSVAGGVAPPPPPPPRISFAGPGLLAGEDGGGGQPGGGQRGSFAGKAARRSSFGGGLGGGGGGPAFAGVSLVNVAPGDSFSGRDLDCRAESGITESPTTEFPPRALAAITLPNTLTALLVISKPVYQRAIRRAGEAMVQQAVAACCRLPFLRHSPLKELFRLSRNLTHATYHKGEVLLQQGKECNNVYFLLEGEVDVCMDVPLGPSETSATQTQAPADAKVSRSGQKTKLPAKGPLQRMLLARRGPGSVLGDDALRDKLMTVSVVVHSPTATVLWTTQNRFTMCADALTLRLFHKLRAQEAASLDVAQSIAETALRDATLERCRGTVLTQAFPGTQMPQTLQRPDNSISNSDSQPPWIASVGSGGFFSETTSIEADLRAMNAAIAEGKHAVNRSKARRKSLQETGAAVVKASKASAATGHLGVCPLCEAENLERFGPMPALSKGITSSWFRGMTMTTSMAQLKQLVQKVEAERAAVSGAGALAQRSCPHRTLPRMDLAGGALVMQAAAAEGVCRVLDMREGLVDSAANRMVTDMMEAACLALIKVSCVPGQRPHGVDELAPILDDALVAWSSVAHTRRLQLVRWSSQETLLLSAIEPAAPQTGPAAAGRRPVVRLCADVLLEMREALEQIVACNKVPHLVMHAGVAVGSAFVGYDTGRFITSVSGMAFDAAQRLCSGAQDCFPEGALLCSDSVMQAISRTHKLGFSGQGYQLLCATALPYNATFEQILGHDAVVVEPASSSTHTTRFISHMQQIHTDEVPSAGGLEAEVSLHFAGAGDLVPLSDGFGAQRQAVARPVGHGIMTHAASRHPQRTQQVVANLTQGSAFCHADVQSPASSTGGSPAAHSPAHSRKRHSTAAFRDELAARTKMTVREKLKAELRELGCNHPAAGDLSRIPHSSFHSPARNTPHPASTPATKAANATAHLNLSSPKSSSPAAAPTSPHSPTQYGFLSRTSAETVCLISPGMASQQPSPHQPLVHQVTPFAPGSGPLADLPARGRAADVLFTRAAMTATQTLPPVCPQSPHTPTHPTSAHPASYDPVNTAGRGGTQLSREAVDATLRAVTTPPKSLAPRSVSSPQPIAASAAVAAVAASTRPVSPTRSSLGPSRSSTPPLALASPSLRPVSPGSAAAHCPAIRATSPTTHIPSNYGMVPVQYLQQTQPPQAGSEGQPSVMAGTAQPGAPSQSVQDRNDSMAPPPGVTGRRKDPVSGMTQGAIHKQAVTAWKDLGSVRAAEHYVKLLPAGILNVSFSTANLSLLPDMRRLAHLESLAAAFNPIETLSSQWLASLSPHLRVLCLSHTNLTTLPSDFGIHLPNLTELNLSCCELEELPESLAAMPKLRALAVEHNKLGRLPSAITSLDGLCQLFVGHNDMVELPSRLDAFTSLELLHAQGNKLQELPSSITKLTSLVSLNVSHNFIPCLPQGALAALTGLRHAALAFNKLCMCPQVHGYIASQRSEYLDDGAFEEPVSRASSRHASASTKEALSRMASFALPTTPSTRPGAKLSHAPSRPVSSGNPWSSMDQERLLTSVLESRKGSAMFRPATAGSQDALRFGARSAATDPGLEAKAAVDHDRRRALLTQRSKTATGADGPADTDVADSGVKAAAAPPGKPQQQASLRHVGFSAAKAPQGTDAADAQLIAERTAVAPQLEPSLAAPGDAAAGTRQQPPEEHDPGVHLPNLLFLDLAGNQLTSVPLWLPPSLTHLNLSKNSLGPGLPDWFFSRLQGLEHLSLDFNQLESMHDDVTCLTRLMQLSLENNPMTDPEQAGSLGEPDCVSHAYEVVTAMKAKARRDVALGEAAQQLSDILGDTGRSAAGGRPTTAACASRPVTAASATRPAGAQPFAADELLNALQQQGTPRGGGGIMSKTSGQAGNVGLLGVSAQPSAISLAAGVA